LLAGCSAPQPPATQTAPGTLAAPSDPKGAEPPAIRKEASDRKAVLAGLKDSVTGSTEARGIDIRSYRFSGLTEPLEVLVQIEQPPDRAGENGREAFSLVTEGPPIPQGVVRMILLPPEATGREGVRVILQVVPDGQGRTQTLSRDVSSLWFGWAKRRFVAQEFAESGNTLKLRRGKGLKLVSYFAQDLATDARISLDLRCRPAAQPGG
jgi:hypothetical protein